MTQTPNETTGDQISVDEWRAIRKQVGIKIDPDIAEVMWTYGYVTDPYGVYTDLTEEEKCMGRIYFARSPDSEIWVSYHDLPVETLSALRGSEQERRSLEAYDAMFNDMDWLFEDAEGPSATVKTAPIRAGLPTASSAPATPASPRGPVKKPPKRRRSGRRENHV